MTEHTAATRHAEHVMEDLLHAQQLAQRLLDALEDDPSTAGTRHVFYARALLGELRVVESELLATPCCTQVAQVATCNDT